MDRGVLWATVHWGLKELDTAEQVTLSLFHLFHICKFDSLDKSEKKILLLLLWKWRKWDRGR